MTMTDTGITLQEIDEDEVTDEQLQRLGIEEYPERPEPHWVGGFDMWRGVNTATVAVPRGQGFNWDEIQTILDRVTQESNEQQRQIDELRYEYVPRFVEPDPVNRNPMRYYHTMLYSENINPIYSVDQGMIYGQRGLRMVMDEATPEPVEPELNIEEPTYENLQEMMRLVEESES